MAMTMIVNSQSVVKVTGCSINQFI